MMVECDTRPPGWLAIAPGSGSRKKNWPLERFVEIAARWREEGGEVLWLLGEAERELELPVQDEVLREIALTVVTARLRECVAFVGNDSGLGHLAGLLGLRTVVLFGPTDPQVWQPLGPQVRVVRSARSENGRMEGIRVAEVWAALIPRIG